MSRHPSLALALLLLLPALAPAQQDPGDPKQRNEQLEKELKQARAEREALEKEVEALRAERNRIQDRMIEVERRFDDVKRKLLDEQERLRNELAQQKRDSALERARLESRIDELTAKERREPAGRPAEEDPAAALERRLDTQRITLNFNETPLEEAAAFLHDLTGLEVKVAPGAPEGLTIVLRGRDLTLRTLLDLIALNARDEQGEPVDLEWRAVEGRIELSRP